MVKFAIATLCALVLFTSAAGAGETVLLDFVSPTCGPCQQMIPIVESLQRDRYPIRRVDITREPQLASQFHVTLVPCFVMLVDGREVKRIVGATSREELERLFPPRGRLQSPDNVSAAPGADSWSNLNGAAANGPARPTLPAANPSQIVSQPSPFDAIQGQHISQAAATTNQTSGDPQLISYSVRLKIDDPNGHSYGTGTIIDTRNGPNGPEALIITCGHLFRDSGGKGPVTVELFAVTADGVRVVDQLPGIIVSQNIEREIGLVSIRPKMAVRAAPIASTKTIIERGVRVTSVGCDNGKDPTALAGRVNSINRYQGEPNIEVSGAPVEGRSGGGLFNSDGQLIGVCYAADYKGNEGLYTALESIHDELDRLGLGYIYERPGQAHPGADQVAGQALTAIGPVVRGQEPPQQVMPMADHPIALASMSQPLQSPAAAPAGLNQTEQAAWEEIMARAGDSEVVCIIRPKDPGGKSEVITLDRVSTAFVRGLASRSAAATGTTTR